MRFYELKDGYAEIGLLLEYKVGNKGKGYYINNEFITKNKEEIIEDMHMRFERYYFEN